jgi:general secretion pathway protein B
MSYILDALKKSELARLNVDMPLQQLLLRGDELASAPRRVWPYVAGAVLLLNLAAILMWWKLLGGSAAEPESQNPPVSQSAQSALRDAPTPTPPANGAAHAEVPAVRALPADTPVVQAKPVPSPPVVVAPATAKPEATVSPSGEPVAAVGKGSRAIAGAAKTAAALPVVSEPAKAAAGDNAALDLPEALRKELPLLVVSGVVRESGTSGWVVVNERPLREGEELVPGLKVEKILERGALFSYKGYRFQR